MFKGAGSETKKAYEYSKLAAAKETAYTAPNGAKVKVSPFADPSDFEDNLQSAKVIADNLGIDIDIRAHLDSNIVEGHKNPEFEINGIVGDRAGRDLEKDTKPQNFITNSMIKLHEKEQLGKFDKAFLVLDFGEIKNVSVKNIKRASAVLQEGFKKFSNLEFVILISDKKVWKINKETVLKISSNDFKIKMNKFIKD